MSQTTQSSRPGSQGGRPGSQGGRPGSQGGRPGSQGGRPRRPRREPVVIPWVPKTILGIKFECLTIFGWFFAKNVNHLLLLALIQEFVWDVHQLNRSVFLVIYVGILIVKLYLDNLQLYFNKFKIIKL